MNLWLEVSQICDISNISRQAIEKTIKGIVTGRNSTWRGATLIVRQVKGRGGRSGLRYEVRLDSLPLELQERWKALRTDLERPLSHGEKVQAERDWRFGLISPAIAHPKHSRERGEAIRKLAGTPFMQPDGSWITPDARTIHRWISAFEAGGHGALSRAKRRDHGTVRVILSRRWDAAVPFPDDVKDRLAEELRQYVRGLHAKGENRQLLREHASRKLRELTTAAGLIEDVKVLEGICRVPDNLIEAEKHFRKVHEYQTDRKAYEDAKPRIRRHRGALEPMEIVVGDIHPLDILITRPDGSTATPRAIAWQDVATSRVWMDLMLLKKGEGIRNAHVIASFIHMAEHWGAPGKLYLDNGSEYNWADFIDDALKLVNSQGRRLIGQVEKLGAQPGERKSQLIRAMPYNASAKPIEGIFAVLESKYFHVLPGWIGGERMKKKTANVGREPEPFPGTLDELRILIAKQLDLYHAVPQRRSALKGRSPNAALQAAIDAGWSRTAIEADAFRVAFSEEKQVTVRQGRIQVGGRTWTCMELQTHPGATITALVPKYEDWARLPLRDDRGRLIGFAEEEVAFGFDDPAGAREARRRSDRSRRTIEKLGRQAPDIDVLGERAATAASLPPPPEIPVGATISASDDAAKILARLTESTEDRRTRIGRERQEEVDRTLKLQNELLAQIRKRK